MPDELRGPAQGPSLIGIGAIAAAAAMLSATQPVLAGTDPFWHWDMGRRILEHGLVSEDPYSFLTSGRDWILNQWGTEVLIGLARAAGGVWLVAVLTALLVGGAMLFTGRVMWRRSPSLITLAAFGLLVASTVTNWSLRGNLFTFLLLPLLLLELRREDGPRAAVVLGVLVVWANLHAAFLLGSGLVVVDTLARVVVAGPGTRVGILRSRLPHLLAAALAGVVTPYGPRFLVAALRLSTRGAGGAAITEWAPTPVLRPVTLPFTTLVVAVLLALAVSARRDDLPDAVLAVAGAIFGISALRNVAAGAIVVGIMGAPHLRGAYVVLRGRPVSGAPGVAPGRIDRVLFAVLVSLGVLAALVLVPRTNRIEAHTSGVPYALITQLDDLDRPARVVTISRWAAAVAALTDDDVRTSVDGRLELFTDDEFADLRTVESADPGWDDILDEWCVTDLLLPEDGPLAAAATADGWSVDERLPDPDEASNVRLTPPSAPCPGR